MLNFNNYPKLKIILLYIYKITIQNFFVFLISNMISKRVDWLTDRIIKNYKKKKKPYKIIFNSQEYQTIDLLSIYSGLSKAFNKKGIFTKNLKFELIPFPENVLNIKFKNRGNITEYETSLKKLKQSCTKYKIKNLYYAILDTVHKYHYRIWKDEFNGCFEFDKKLFKSILNFKKKFSKIASKYDAVIFPDSAYIHNQIIKQEFIKKGKKAIVLSPSAGYFECKNFNDSEASGLKSKNNLHQYNLNKKKIEIFIKNRFSANSNNDHYNFAYKYQKNSKIKKLNKDLKILYLHSFTDSNNQSWHQNQPFVNHFEWTEYTIKNLAKIKFRNWYFKIHPVSKFSVNKNSAFNNQAYGNDQILNYFILKYKIPKSVFSKCPSGIDILKNKIPIYTNSSSIVLESLMFDYKTFFSGSKYDRCFGKKALSKNQWKRYLFQKNTKSYTKVSNNTKKEAKYLLWEISSRNLITKISPDGWIYSWAGKFGEIKLAFNFLLKMMFSKK